MSLTPAQLGKLPPAIRHGIVTAFVNSLVPVFEVGVPISFISWVLTWFLKEVKLRESSGLKQMSVE